MDPSKNIEDMGQHTAWQDRAQVLRRSVRDINEKLALLEATTTSHKLTAVQTLHPTNTCPKHAQSHVWARYRGEAPRLHLSTHNTTTLLLHDNRCRHSWS